MSARETMLFVSESQLLLHLKSQSANKYKLSNEEWSSQLWSQFLQLRKEAWKKFRTSTGLEPVTSRYRCDALPTELWSHWRWEQVNFGFICSRERHVSEWCIWNKSYVNCGYEIKWRMILAVMIAILQWFIAYDLFHMHHSITIRRV